MDRDPWSLTKDAALAAIADAGLEVDAIDGLSTYPGAIGSTPGITGAGTDDVRSMLGIRTRWHTGGMELPGQLGALVNAMMAVHSGLAEHVLLFRTVWEDGAQRQAGSRAAAVKSANAREWEQWSYPYGFGYPTFGGLTMQRYFHMSGSGREQMAHFARVVRDNALLNPHGVFDTPLSIDDYMNARMMSDPLCLFDCDMPIDGSVAFVVSASGSQAMDRKRALAIEAIGSSTGYDACAEMMWSRTDLTPKDIDFAQLYDGFSILAVLWMEAVGLVGKGEALRFMDGGERIARNGELPLNTDGGQLSAGRMHGFGYLYEACLQLRGEAGERQIGKDARAGIVTSGAGDFTSSLILRRV
jgi:acetyl-CoA acetyltransferase